MKNSTTPSPRSGLHEPRRDHRSNDFQAKDVSKILRMIRPSFQAQGGNVELVDINDGSVVIRLTGACDGCPISFKESSGVIERIIRSRIPQIRVFAVV